MERTQVTSPAELPHQAVESKETTERIAEALRQMAPMYQASIVWRSTGSTRASAPDLAPRDSEKTSGRGDVE